MTDDRTITYWTHQYIHIYTARCCLSLLTTIIWSFCILFKESRFFPLSLMTLASVGLKSSACLVDNKNKDIMKRHHRHHSSFWGHCHRRVTLISSPTPRQPEANRNSDYQKTKKQVRFCNDDQLEHVRFFSKTQEPIAIRKGDACLSPVVKIKYPNWPSETLNSQPRGMIHMESMQQILVKTRMSLMGQCRVANVAFQKHIAVRYTTNDWQTYHEVEAMYRESILNCTSPWDRFIFYIDLENKGTCTTVYFALRYNVKGKEYWDNNGGINYQINVVIGDYDDDFNDRRINKEMYATSIKTSMQAHHGNLPSNSQRDYMLLQDSTAGIAKKRTTKERLAHRYNFGASLSAAKKAISMHKKDQQISDTTSHHHHLLHGRQDQQQENSELKYRDIIARYCFYDHPTPSSTTTTLSSSCTCPKPVFG